jgi:hypothetical protein
MRPGGTARLFARQVLPWQAEIVAPRENDFSRTRDSALSATPFVQTVFVPLRSPSDTLPIQVTKVSATDSCPKCWLTISANVSDKNPLSIDAGTTGLLSVNIAARYVPSLLRGALILDPNVPHDTLDLVVTYHTVPGGADREQPVSVNIRFRPTLPELALGLLAGIALGLIARYLVNGRLGKDKESKAHAIMTALVFGIVAEAIGVLLVSIGNSEVKIFGLELDPRQVFPAFILVMLVSGGSGVVSWIQNLYKSMFTQP